MWRCRAQSITTKLYSATHRYDYSERHVRAPLFTTANFDGHLINKDTSLGTCALFANRRTARAAIYETKDGLRHLQFFDGRPGSDVLS